MYDTINSGRTWILPLFDTLGFCIMSEQEDSGQRRLPKVRISFSI